MVVDIIAIVVASIAAFAFGALWYSPPLFMSAWCKEAGIDPDVQVDNPVKIYGLTFLLTLVSAIGIFFVVEISGGLLHGLFIGSLVGGLIVMSSMGINYQFAQRSLKHWFIDGGFQVGRFAIMGGIIGLF